MIVIENRQMLIPRGEEKIGTTADNLCDTRTFSIPRVSATLLDLSALDFLSTWNMPMVRRIQTLCKPHTARKESY